MVKKDNIHAPQKCGGSFVCEWNEQNLPYLVCQSCGHKIEDWIRWETNYKDLWKDESSWAESKNHLTVLLGYFCNKYEQYYKMPFHFSYGQNGLFRGPEAVMIRRLLGSFENKPTEVKQYIDWYFDQKIGLQKKKLTSLSPMTVQSVVGAFRHIQQNAKKITRSTLIPEKMKEWIATNTPSILTITQLVDYGDLQQLLNYWTKSPQDEDAKKFIAELSRRNTIDLNLKICRMEP